MILGINTGSEKNSIALYGTYLHTPTRCMQSWESYRTQSKELLPMIDNLLHQNNHKLSDLTAIAVFKGPGSYTGLRVGISVANSLAWSLNIPVIGVKITHSTCSKQENKISNIKNTNKKLKNFTDEPSNYLTDQPINYFSALEVAKQADKILTKRKTNKFIKIIIPKYSSRA